MSHNSPFIFKYPKYLPPLTLLSFRVETPFQVTSPPPPPEVSWQSHFRWNSVSHDSVAQVYLPPPPSCPWLTSFCRELPARMSVMGCRGGGCLPFNRCANSNRFIEQELALESISFETTPSHCNSIQFIASFEGTPPALTNNSEKPNQLKLILGRQALHVAS